MTDISYITSCYNAAPFLDGLIENLLKQSHENFEHIIVDSASTDNSVEVIKRWQEKDDRIRLVEQNIRTNYGVSWLVGWFRAEGMVVSNSNADDRSYPWRGHHVLSYHNYAIGQDRRAKKSNYHFYYGGYETRVDGVVTAKGLPPAYSEYDLSQFFRCGVHVHWDNELREMVNWDVMLKAAEEYKSAFDYWLVLYFMSLGVTGVAIPGILSIYNQRSDSLEQANKELNTFESLRAIETFYPSSPAIQNLEKETKYQNPGFYQRYQNFLAEFA